MQGLAHEQLGSPFLRRPYLFYAVLDAVLDDADILELAEPVHPVHSLCLGHRVPVGFNNVDLGRYAQVGAT